MKKKIFFMLIVLVMFTNQALGQKDGLKVFNKKYFEHFAMLLRDTTQNSANIFINEYYVYRDSSNIYNSPFVVDSCTMIQCEKILRKYTKKYFCKKKSTKINYISDINLKKNCNYIRLYIGYFDEKGNKIVLIQFVTLSEYNKYEKTLSKEVLFYPNNINSIPLRYVLIQLN